jgi:hypothetical protein
MMTTAAFMFPLAAMTLMLWILWNDSIRPASRSHTLVYVIRAVIFVGVTVATLHNFIVHYEAYTAAATALVILASIVGVGGSIYLIRKAIIIWRGGPPPPPPPPSLNLE